MFWKTAIEPEPETLRIRERGKISFGIPSILHKGAKTDEITFSAPEADNSSMATTKPISEGRISVAQLSPLTPPRVKADQIFTFLNRAQISTADIKSGTEKDARLFMVKAFHRFLQI